MSPKRLITKLKNNKKGSPGDANLQHVLEELLYETTTLRQSCGDLQQHMREMQQ